MQQLHVRILIQLWVCCCMHACGTQPHLCTTSCCSALLVCMCVHVWVHECMGACMCVCANMDACVRTCIWHACMCVYTCACNCVVGPTMLPTPSPALQCLRLCRPSGERLVSILGKSLEIMGAKSLDYGKRTNCSNV